MIIAAVYAKALLETAQEAKLSVQELDTIEKELESLSVLIQKSKSLRVALTGPATSSREKKAVITQLAQTAGLSPLVSRFLALVGQKNRLGLLDELREKFTEMRLDNEGGLMARMISADTVTAEEQDRVRAVLEKKFKKKVLLRSNVDSRLVAGSKVLVGGLTYDGTIRAQLQKLRDKFVFGIG